MAWDLGGVDEAEDVRAAAGDGEDVAGVAGVHLDGGFWDGVEHGEDGAAVVVHVVEREVGVWDEEGEGIGGEVEHGGVEGGPREDALVVAGEAEVEAQAGCLE